MNKSILNTLFFSLAILLMVAVSCKKDDEVSDVPYLELRPESCNGEALGDGDGLLLSIRSNMDWIISAVDADDNPIDWIVFEVTAGSGDADLLCFILRGSLDEERSCKIIVSSKDGQLTKNLDISQGIFIPVMTHVKLADVIRNAYSQSVDVPGLLADFTIAEVEVVGVPGGNLPDGYVYVSDKGKVWARIKMSQTPSVNVGDVIQMEFTGGTITKDSYGAYTIELVKEPVVLSSGDPTITPAYISVDAISSYENMLVELRNVQAQDNIAGSAWNGDVTMLAADEADAEFQVHVDSGASFGNISTGCGYIRGIVVGGKVCPRFVEDIAGLTGPRLPSYSSPYQITPVINVIKCGTENNTLANGTITDKTRLTFSEEPGYSVAGASIEKVGGGTGNNMTIAATTTAAPFNSCFTTVQWHLDNTYLLYTVPVAQKIFGKLEFSFSISCGKLGVFDDVWTVSWSSDGIDFKPVDAVYCTDVYTEDDAEGSTFTLTNDKLFNNRQVAEFTIPENEAVSSGNIYFKLMHPAVGEDWKSRTLRMNCGSVLSSRVINPSVPEYDNILCSENFETCLYGHNPVLGIPTYYFTYFNALDPANTYSSAKGWSVTGKSLACRGCLRLSSDSGKNYIETPSLEMLDVPTDITVTFKVAPFVDATKSSPIVHEDNVSVAVSGSGTVGSISWDSEYLPYQWRTASLKILGASANTRVLIGNIDGANTSQFYIDDIIISR